MVGVEDDRSLPIGKVYFWVVKNGGVQKPISTIFGQLDWEPSIDHCCGINMANNAGSMFTMAASSKRTQVDGVYPCPRKMKSIRISLGDAPLPRNSVHHKNFHFFMGKSLWANHTGILERGGRDPQKIIPHPNPHPPKKK